VSAQQYRLVVKGELGRRYASAFEGMTISAHDGITELSGPIIDPAHLQGLFERIAGLGLTVYSLTPLDPAPVDTPLPGAGLAGTADSEGTGT
jgi:hypothetical protein